MKKWGLVSLLWLLLIAPQVQAQSVQQSGTVTVGQAARWVSNGIVGTGGTAADGLITQLGITNNGLSSFCISSARASAAGRNQLCLGAQTSGAAVISLQNYGTATAQDLQFNINGTTIVLPTGGTGFVQYTGTLISGDLSCWSGTSGLLADCGYSISGAGTNKIPYWSSSSVLTAMTAAASSVLVTSAGNVPSLSQTLPSAVQSNITAVGSITSGVWSGTPVTIVGGGTGAASFTAFGVMLSGTTTTSALSSLATAQIGYCLLSQGASSFPIWASCASGTGTAGGSDTQVQFNNSTNLAGSANFTWVSPALTLGQNATTTGQLKLANGGALGVSVTLQNLGATSAYNFNLPVSAGTSGQPLISGGGSSTSMTFGTLQVAGGGTACSAASGNCLDNITNFSSTGYINRQGSGTYAFSTLIPLSSGGTNANLTASNGGIFYSTATAGAILSGTATANQILMSGLSTAPAWSTAVYPATTSVSQLLYSSSANVIAGLTTGNNGVLVTSAGGVPSISSTIPSATQDNITRVGTIVSGVWTGTSIALANGGTSAALTASNGGIFYSTASAGAILSGTATANLPLLSGSSTTPAWAAISYPASATSGGIPYFSSTTAMASSAALGANQIVIGGGAGAAPSTFACATATTVVHGGTPPTCSQIVAGDVTTNTLTNATLAQMAAVTLKGNPTASTANASDFTIAGLTSRGSPDATNDLLLLWDAASGTLKKVTPAAIASSATAGVSSIAGNTGAFTLANGIDNSTNQIQLTAARRTLPTTQTLTTGTGATYTTPANCLWIEVWITGGGGGGGGGGTASNGTGGTGGSATFNSVVAAGGTGGVAGPTGTSTIGTQGGLGGTGGTGTATLRVAGATGGWGTFGTAAINNGASGHGGASGMMRGAGGQGIAALGGAGVNGGAGLVFGGGGGGGGSGDGGRGGPGGGGGGETAYLIINSPAGTYTYTIGAAGTAGTAGTGGGAGGAGALPGIFVIEHYGT